ncbi:hypothetical protein P691DRAFT_809903 [Macrolepiota fuliginosa MF-IS2]|uniref:Uncharacterized protein n=1 Tax=Macrolepiota fuliginosa MF-IS2 TaxID=1400762 RepID=A0A9P6C9U4_9AGAR|nr:hypothetical protein P691DRAFT_809903 [Macrolepiota fuliginosa MF-IS2]
MSLATKSQEVTYENPSNFSPPLLATQFDDNDIFFDPGPDLLDLSREVSSPPPSFSSITLISPRSSNFDPQQTLPPFPPQIFLTPVTTTMECPSPLSLSPYSNSFIIPVDVFVLDADLPDLVTPVTSPFIPSTPIPPLTASPICPLHVRPRGCDDLQLGRQLSSSVSHDGRRRAFSSPTPSVHTLCRKKSRVNLRDAFMTSSASFN